jgi:hypothetical protein
MVCFGLFSIKLSQSHDLSHEFYRLTRLDSDRFIMFIFRLNTF